LYGRVNRTGKDRTGQDRTGQDRTGQDRTAHYINAPMTYVADGMSLALRNCKVTKPSLQPIKDRVRGFSVNPNHNNLCNDNRRLGLGLGLRLGIRIRLRLGC
jgi:hypothetical protein